MARARPSIVAASAVSSNARRAVASASLQSSSSSLAHRRAQDSDAPRGSAQRDQRRSLLFLHAESAEAGELVRAVSEAQFDVASCPLSALRRSHVIEAFEPELILLEPPFERTQLIETCEAIRGQTNRPIVVLSSCGEELAIASALAAGMDEYLVLPVSTGEFSARITALLRRMSRQAGTDRVIQVGELTLARDDQSVELNNRKILLTPIEFRLLSCLASLPNKILTHETLMSRVWGAEHVASRHYLHLYIRYLREKLEDDPNHPRMIINEWGVGYRLIATAPPEP